MLFQIRLGYLGSAPRPSQLTYYGVSSQTEIPSPKGERKYFYKQTESTWLGQRSGNWNSGFNNQGTNGNYWSSTQNSATNAYNLNFNSSNVNPANNNNKNNGFAVRCVAAV